MSIEESLPKNHSPFSRSIWHLFLHLLISIKRSSLTVARMQSFVLFLLFANTFDCTRSARTCFRFAAIIIACMLLSPSKELSWRHSFASRLVYNFLQWMHVWLCVPLRLCNCTRPAASGSCVHTRSIWNMQPKRNLFHPPNEPQRRGSSSRARDRERE